MAYLSLHLAKQNGADDGNNTMSASLIEKIVKIFKTHRNVLDQEQAFLRDVIAGMKKVGFDV